MSVKNERETQLLVLQEHPDGSPKLVAYIEPGATVAYFKVKRYSEWGLSMGKSSVGYAV